MPGNPRRSITITVAHGFLARALAFLVAAAAAQTALAGGAVRPLSSAVVTTTSAAVQGAGSAVGVPVPIDPRLAGLLESIGYSRAESTQRVGGASGDLQDVLRGRAGQVQAQRAGEQVRGGLDTLFTWASLHLWIWFATWVLTGALSMLGAAMVVNRVRRVPERESGIVRDYRQVIEAHSH